MLKNTWKMTKQMCFGIMQLWHLPLLFMEILDKGSWIYNLNRLDPLPNVFFKYPMLQLLHSVRLSFALLLLQSTVIRPQQLLYCIKYKMLLVYRSIKKKKNQNQNEIKYPQWLYFLKLICSIHLTSLPCVFALKN